MSIYDIIGFGIVLITMIAFLLFNPDNKKGKKGMKIFKDIYGIINKIEKGVDSDFVVVVFGIDEKQQMICNITAAINDDPKQVRELTHKFTKGFIHGAALTDEQLIEEIINSTNKGLANGGKNTN